CGYRRDQLSGHPAGRAGCAQGFLRGPALGAPGLRPAALRRRFGQRVRAAHPDQGGCGTGLSGGQTRRGSQRPFHRVPPVPIVGQPPCAPGRGRDPGDALSPDHARRAGRRGGCRTGDPRGALHLSFIRAAYAGRSGRVVGEGHRPSDPAGRHHRPSPFGPGCDRRLDPGFGPPCLVPSGGADGIRPATRPGDGSGSGQSPHQSVCQRVFRRSGKGRIRRHPHPAYPGGGGRTGAELGSVDPRRVTRKSLRSPFYTPGWGCRVFGPGNGPGTERPGSRTEIAETNSDPGLTGFGTAVRFMRTAFFLSWSHGRNKGRYQMMDAILFSSIWGFAFFLLLAMVLLWGLAANRIGRLPLRSSREKLRKSARRSRVLLWLALVTSLLLVGLAALTLVRFGWMFVQEWAVFALPAILITHLAVILFTLPRLKRLARDRQGTGPVSGEER